jgi:hypothetical protein
LVERQTLILNVVGSNPASPVVDIGYFLAVL